MAKSTNNLHQNLNPYSILPPDACRENLLFQVFDQARPIAYARLKKLRQERAFLGQNTENDRPHAYALKMIEVSQNYRKQGIGSLLLREIIRFCRDSKVSRLTGDIKGDENQLRRWYASNGFSITSRGSIEMSPLSDNDNIAGSLSLLPTVSPSPHTKEHLQN